MKKFIRKVAAIGAGSAMIIGTLGGAMAAGETLADLPAPFVANNAYADVAMVVGADAGTNDDAARTTVKGYFDDFATGSDAGAILSSSKTEKIFIGENLSQEFSARLHDGHISTFWDDGIDFRGGNYETHEELIVSAAGDGVYVASSGLTGEEELSDAIKLYTNGANVSWGYRYVFDENFSQSDAINTSKEVKINFLGKEIRISDATASTNSVTLTTGAQSSQGQDTTTTVNGHTIHIGTIFNTKAEIWVDDEDHQFMSEDDVETFNIGSDQVEIKLDSIGYTEDVASRTVLVTTGENIETSVKHNDAVQTELDEADVDDDADDATWNWDVNVSRDDHFDNGDWVGVYWNQKVNKWNDEPAPLGAGEYWSTPWGFVTMDMTVPEMDYKEYSFTMEVNYDINSTHEQDVLLITAVGMASSNEGLDYEGTDTSKVAVNDSGAIWYEDLAGDFQAGAGTALAMGVTQGGADTLSVEASSDTNKWVAFDQNDYEAMNGSEAVTFMFIEDVESDDENLYTGANWSANVSIANSRFGATVDADDVGDLSYFIPATAHGASATRQVQTWDNGVARSIYGTMATGSGGMNDGDIESSLDSDDVRMWFPEDEVYAEVTFNVRSSGATIEAPLTTESGAGSYDNLILVGGPCVNTLTADYMGLTYPACEGASTITENKGIVQLFEDGGKTALVVAGWEKADTQRAASALAAGGLTGTSHIVE